MQYKYAQMNMETNVVIGVSFLSGEMDLPGMVLLQEDDDVLPGDILNPDGTWLRPTPPEPQPDPRDVEIANLKSQMATMAEAIDFLLMKDL